MFLIRFSFADDSCGSVSNQILKWLSRRQNAIFIDRFDKNGIVNGIVNGFVDANAAKPTAVVRWRLLEREIGGLSGSN